MNLRMGHNGDDSILLSEILFNLSTNEDIFKDEHSEKGPKSDIHIGGESGIEQSRC